MGSCIQCNEFSACKDSNMYKLIAKLITAIHNGLGQQLLIRNWLQLYSDWLRT
jgi:hypothetical protein